MHRFHNFIILVEFIANLFEQCSNVAVTGKYGAATLCHSLHWPHHLHCTGILQCTVCSLMGTLHCPNKLFEFVGLLETSNDQVMIFFGGTGCVNTHLKKNSRNTKAFVTSRLQNITVSDLQLHVYWIVEDVFKKEEVNCARIVLRNYYYTVLISLYIPGRREQSC